MKRFGSCRLALAWGAASFFERAENWIDQVLEDDADTAHGIVVGGDWVGDDGWVGVAVHHGDDWDVQAGRFADGDTFTVAVHDDDDVRSAFQFTNPAQVAQELFALAAEGGEFLLGHHFELGLLVDFFQILEALDALADRGKIRQRATEPTVIDVKLACCLGGFTHGVLSLAFATDEQNAFAFTGGAAEEIGSGFQLLGGFFQIENVNSILLSDDEGLHVRMPLAALVTEMHACFDEFLEEF